MSVLSGLLAKLEAARLVTPAEVQPSQHAPAPAPACPANQPTPATPERRNCWRVSRPGHSPFPMIGPPMTRAEALEEVRARWSDASIHG